jgi:hypothetical protein
MHQASSHCRAIAVCGERSGHFDSGPHDDLAGTENIGAFARLDRGRDSHLVEAEITSELTTDPQPSEWNCS